MCAWLGKKKLPTEPDIPETTSKVPLVPYKVVAAGIPFYRDPECSQEVPDARLCILRALDPDQPVLELDLVPTFRRYRKGDYVTWVLNSKKLWEACWYRDPKTGETKQAWNFHVEFLGSVIEPSAIIQEKDRIEELERKIEERLAESRQKEAQSERVN